MDPLNLPRSTAPDIIQRCRFGISQLDRRDESGDRWHNQPVDFAEARRILVFNGFTPLQADDALTDLVDEENWFPIRSTLLIS